MITSFPLKMKRYPACVGHRTVAELSTRLNCPLQKNTRVVLHCILHGSRGRNRLGIRSSAKLSQASRLVQIQLDRANGISKQEVQQGENDVFSELCVTCARYTARYELNNASLLRK